MAEEQKPKAPEAASTPEKPDKPEKPQNVSAFRNAAELEARARREAELRERERQAAEEKAAYKAREEYAKELAEDKVELIRLKQGVITESEKVFGTPEPEKHYTIWQKIGNWFYHAKWWLGIATFCVVLGAFLIYDYCSREDPDLRVLQVAQNQELYAEAPALCDWLETLCDDFNQNGEVLVSTVYVPVNTYTMEQAGMSTQGTSTQLMVQFQTNTCMLVLCDTEAEKYLEPASLFADMEKLYPDCTFAEGYKLRITKTDFAEQFGFSAALQDDMYLALRLPMENMNSLEENQAAYDQAKLLLDRLVAALHEKEN